MKNYFFKAMALALAIAAPAAAMAQTPDEILVQTDFYLMHSSGHHAARSDAGKAVLEAADAAAPQMLTFAPAAEKGYYTIAAPDGSGYLALEGGYSTTFTADASAARAQWAIRPAGKHYIKLECRSNGKYLGTDATDAGSTVFADKSGNDSRHHWFLSTDPKAVPPIDELSYIINPEAERQHFDGWGVSLCWWANMCGKWSDEKIDEIVDWLVSPDGLNFRIFRYNIGGGDDPANANCTEHHMGSGKGLRAEMEGFKDSSDGPYIWIRDEAQRKIMLKIKEKRPDAIFEAFSNSAPWYMTYSGCVAGNTNSGRDNLRTECYEEFAHYLVDVCKHYKDEYGIEFYTLEPFNEPMTSYWGANGGQEGCHFDVASQIAFLKVLDPILRASGLSTIISASDETSVAQSVKDFQAYAKDGVLDLVGQWNVHTYTADDKSRAQIAALCMDAGMPLWMSEVGAGGKGLAGNLNLARKLIDDMRHIMPSAWIDWQYIEEGNDQWCLVKAGSFAKGSYEKVKNYYVRSHFSRFIKEGYTILTSLNGQTLAARNPEGNRLVLVVVNSGSAATDHRVDLSMYDSAGSPLEAYITTESDDMAPFTDCSLEAEQHAFTFRMPPLSIATFVLPVLPRSADVAAPSVPEAGRNYLICPRLSASLALDATGGKVAVRELSYLTAQAWTLADAPGEPGAVTLANANGRRLTATDEVYALSAPFEAGAGQSFVIEPVDDFYYKISTPDGARAFDLEGEKAADGTGVGMWEYGTSAAAVHRQWAFVEIAEELLTSGIRPAEIAGGMEGDSPVRIAAAGPGILQVDLSDDAPAELRVYNAAGSCIGIHCLTAAGLQLPLRPGYYIAAVATAAGARYAAPVLIR